MSTVSPHQSHFWVLAGIVAGIVMFTVFSEREKTFVADDFALGENTASVLEQLDGRRISGHFNDAQLLRDSFAAFRRGNRRVALWLGNSQTHAINKASKKDHLAVWYTSKMAMERGSDLGYLLMSEPNANLYEMLCMYLSFRQERLVPDVLVLGFAYGNLQQSGIRKAARAALRPLPEDLLVEGNDALHTIDAAIADPESDDAHASVPVARSATAGTLQERIENSLVRSLEDVWPSYRWRGELRSRAIASLQIELTSTLFKLFTPPKKAIPAAMQTWNEGALDALVTLAKRDGVRVLIYKAPYRQEWQSSQLDRNAYDSYHMKLAERCKRDGISYLDLGTLVPVQYWGRANGGDPDFYHFTDAGHRMLASAIDEWLQREGY